MPLATALPGCLAVGTYFGSAVFVHFRGKVRHKFSRQLRDHSTFLAPYNAFVYFYCNRFILRVHRPLGIGFRNDVVDSGRFSCASRRYGFLRCEPERS